jgi:signal transduction histidine kinase/membrane protease YdiL (CAAX protease family)
VVTIPKVPLPARAEVPGLVQLTWPKTVAAHLAPGMVAFCGALALAPPMARLGLPPTFALTVSCAVLLAPIELGLLLRAAYRATGRRSLSALPAVLAYRQRLGRWVWSTPALFAVALIVAIGWAPVGDHFAQSLQGVYPPWLLPGYNPSSGRPTTVMVAVLLVTLLLDGVIVPTVEELYFRAYLLPRLPVSGWRAVPISAALFAAQHYWQPFNWPLIFVLQVILTALVIRTRSIRLGIVMHVVTNCFGIGEWLVGAFRAPCWRALGYLLVGVPVTALGWVVALLAIVAGGLLSVTVVGVRVIPLLLVLTRAAAGLERRRCSLVGDAPANPYRPLLAGSGRARLAVQLRDPTTWRDVGWLVLAAPINLICLVVAGCLWAISAGLISLPLWYRFLPGGRAKLYESGGVAHGVIASVPAALPWALGGVVLLWIAGWTTRAVTIGQARLAASLLGPTRNSGLLERVETLTTTRIAAVEEQHRELRRIERDLHDGAQARLVAVSADLGLAGESFDEDPQQARQLVERARDGILLALAELRDLVRGIGPPILRDRGLAAALEAIAARSPIPVTTTVDLPHRSHDAVEVAAYFVVCEALANAAKHSQAHHLSVDVHQEHGRCLMTVADDGIGGADPCGAGLRGLADRVAALDGTLRVQSPPGGPTIVQAVLPCGS